MWFSADARDAYPDLDLDALEHALERVGGELAPEIARTEDDLAGLVCFMARSLVQCCLRRNRELGVSFVDSFNRGLTVPLFVSARAILETACVAHDLARRIERLIERPTESQTQALTDHLMSATFGCKTDILIGDPELYRMPNVLTLVGKVSEGSLAPLRTSYDGLSEFAHPNFLGMHHLFETYSEDENVVVFAEDPFRMSEARLEMAVVNAHLGLRMTLLAWLSLGPREGQLRASLYSAWSDEPETA